MGRYSDLGLFGLPTLERVVCGWAGGLIAGGQVYSDLGLCGQPTLRVVCRWEGYLVVRNRSLSWCLQVYCYTTAISMFTMVN